MCSTWLVFMVQRTTSSIMTNNFTSLQVVQSLKSPQTVISAMHRPADKSLMLLLLKLLSMHPVTKQNCQGYAVSELFLNKQRIPCTVQQPGSDKSQAVDEKKQ